MQIYIDTADSQAISHYLSTGIFSGVTCNPVILRDGGYSPATAHEFYRLCQDAGAEEIFLQSFGHSVQEIVDQGLRYRDYGPEIVVKVVSTTNGAAAASKLAEQGVPVLLTAAHHAKQAVVALAAGATYFAPYLSEMNRASRYGHDEISTMHQILNAPGSHTKLVLAGLDNVAEIVRYAQEGIHYMTLTPDIAQTLLEDSFTTDMEVMFNGVSL
ncbi:MAG: transaldolase family protein [Beutenbergiaceae bacterium]